MRVSIIIPTWQEAEGIGLAVQRAMASGADEVLVIDGGSSDGTATLAASAGATVAVSEAGRARQQNHGAKLASGDVLLFLHADNWLAAGAVQQVREALREPNVAGGSFRQRIEANGLGYRLLELGNMVRARWMRRPFGDQGIFLRRTVFEAAQRFPDVPLCEEILLMRRIPRRQRLALLTGPLHVSPRRWQKRGILRQTLCNWRIIGRLWMGTDPRELARSYPRHGD